MKRQKLIIFHALLAFFTVFLSISATETIISNTCIRDCSGHGRCVDFECECEPGFDGEDCGTGEKRKISYMIKQ